jgi:hypothetical protein
MEILSCTVPSPYFTFLDSLKLQDMCQKLMLLSPKSGADIKVKNHVDLHRTILSIKIK